MDSSIHISDKRNFLKWFLAHYQLKTRESRWILNYLLAHETMLQHVHFIRDHNSCSRLIVISTQHAKEDAFIFYKEHVMTKDAEKAYHDIRMNQTSALFVQLKFQKNQLPLEYLSVLEDNPYDENSQVRKTDKIITNQLVSQLEYEFEERRLKQAIDTALKNNDHMTFKKLAFRLKKLKNY